MRYGFPKACQRIMTGPAPTAKSYTSRPIYTIPTNIYRQPRLIPCRLLSCLFSVCELLRGQVLYICEFSCDDFDVPGSYISSQTFSSTGFPEGGSVFGCVSLYLLPSVTLQRFSVDNQGSRQFDQSRWPDQTTYPLLLGFLAGVIFVNAWKFLCTSFLLGNKRIH